jgi:hypothetical protein
MNYVLNINLISIHNILKIQEYYKLNWTNHPNNTSPILYKMKFLFNKTNETVIYKSQITQLW